MSFIALQTDNGPRNINISHVTAFWFADGYLHIQAGQWHTSLSDKQQEAYKALNDATAWKPNGKGLRQFLEDNDK